MAIHSSVLAWRIPWAEKPGSLCFIGSHSQTLLKQLSMHTHIYIYTLFSFFLKKFMHMAKDFKQDVRMDMTNSLRPPAPDPASSIPSPRGKPL